MRQFYEWRQIKYKYKNKPHNIEPYYNYNIFNFYLHINFKKSLFLSTNAPFPLLLAPLLTIKVRRFHQRIISTNGFKELSYGFDYLTG